MSAKEACKCCGNLYPILEFAEHVHQCAKCKLSGTPVSDEVFPDVPFERYLTWNLPSQTSLKAGRISMMHLKAKLDGEFDQKVTDDMTLGAALGTAFLEPARMPERVVLWEGGVRRSKAWDEFRKQHSGKAILTRKMHDKLIGMVSALRKHPDVRKMLTIVQNVELSAVGPIEGVRVKGRCDMLTKGMIVDVKKVTSCDDRTIANVVERLGYFIQGPCYQRLFNRDRFELLCVEGTFPHAVRRVTFTDDYIKDGDNTLCGILQGLKHCRETGEWPGYGDEPLELDVPAYRDNGADDVTIGGEAAFGEAA